MEKIFGSYSEKELRRIEPIKDEVLNLESKYEKMSDRVLRDQTEILKKRAAEGDSLDVLLPDAFAVVREAAWRVLGLKAFPVQIIGGIVLHQGRIAEMKTGEGKTLVAIMPAYLNALTGKGVHIVTVNDYLAKYQSEEMGKVFRFLGMSVGLIIRETKDKKAAYAADVTYGTNNEFGFDYLRDNMVTRREDRVMRMQNFAIVDEVDSILIDEARTPLIISGAGDKSSDMYARANMFAAGLKPFVIAETDNKEDQDDVDADYIVDEKAKTATLTPRGIKKAEEYFHVETLTDSDNISLMGYINQAIMAHGVKKKEIDYVVKDGEVIIVDEFTGRLMIGRRYSNGLHQAIEAKEGVQVQKESKTMATITFQNFFRQYTKLSGMTGTAKTEEDEFREIYKLDIVEIPTNKPVIRQDHDDVVFKTLTAKYNAVIDQVAECHAKGQPVLVGTVSIEKSELLSGMLRRKGIKHNVLNAKYHEKEAQIVAQAGQFGAVTIATNMAGRGTDIKLGGNAEYLAKNRMVKQGYDELLVEEASGFAETEDEEILEARKVYNEWLDKYREEIAPQADKVREAGGLFIIGTERHDARRIDNQLRGRSGRQGDPGESRFFLSLEDNLMRLFGGERLQNMMNMLKVEDDLPIENKFLTKSIRSAQEKVEDQHFAMRKNVLAYDDVMNQQRAVIYEERNRVLDQKDVQENILKMMNSSIDETVKSYLADTDVHEEWNIKGLKDHYFGWLTTETDFNYTPQQLADIQRETIISTLQSRALAKYKKLETLITPKVMREIERVILLRTVDRNWIEHIDAMDELRQGIGLRAFGQHDPVVEYRIEGSQMFEEMIAVIREDTYKGILLTRVRVTDDAGNTVKENANPSADTPQKAPDLQQPKVALPEMPRVQMGKLNASLGSQPVKKVSLPVKKQQIGRNDPCPCGSGLKYKKCCGRDQ